MSAPNPIGENPRFIAALAGELSDSEIAERFGVSQAAVSYWRRKFEACGPSGQQLREALLRLSKSMDRSGWACRQCVFRSRSAPDAFLHHCLTGHAFHDAAPLNSLPAVQGVHS